MNRRSFLTQMLKTGVGFSILPAAATYARQWRFNRDSGLELPYVIEFQRCMDGIYRQLKECDKHPVFGKIYDPFAIKTWLS